MNTQYKLGDIYPNWKKLEPLPNYKWEELKESHGVTEETLFVRLVGGTFPEGKIIKLEKDDGSLSPLFIDGKEWEYSDINKLAILPTQEKTPEQVKKTVWTVTHTTVTVDGKKTEETQTAQRDDGISIVGNQIAIRETRYTLEAAEAYEKKLRAGIAMYKKLNSTK